MWSVFVRIFIGSSALILALFTAGCANSLDSIDRQANELMEARSQAFGGLPARAGSYEKPRSLPRTEEDRTPSPGTSNPAADDLSFDAASEDRDVAARLTAYTDEAIDSGSESALQLDLPAAFGIAQSSSREFLTAEEDYLLSAIRLMIQQHRWGPRLFNETSATLSGFGDRGNFDHTLRLINTLRVTQRLPFGGEVEARWVASATDQLRDVATDSYLSSSNLILSANIPLLRGAGQVAREDLVQAQRDLVYAARDFEQFRRSLLVSIARDYFQLLETERNIVNRTNELDAQRSGRLQTRAKVDAGLREPFQLEITRNAVARSEASLAGLRETYVLQLERFKVRLGLAPTAPIVIIPLEFALAAPEISPAEASVLAIEFRLDLQNRRDRLADGRRSVNNAANNLLPDLNLSTEIGIPTDPNSDTGIFGLDGRYADYRVGASLSIPLDRKIERLNFRQAQISLARAERNYDEFRDRTIIDARAAVRAIDLAEFQLDLAEQAIGINERGLQDLALRDSADTQAKLDRQNDLLDAQNGRDAAVTDLRNSILDYLLTTGQLRVGPDGRLQALPGMRADETTADPAG